MLSKRYFEEKLRREGWSGFDLGHTETLHIGLSDEAMALRLLGQKERQGKSHPVSTFATRKSADDCITRGLLLNSEGILQWADLARPGETLTYHVRLRQIVGRGFDNNFNEVITPAMTIVLRRDNYSVNGFYVLSAFPKLDSPLAEKTGRTALDVVRKTKIFKESSPLKKAYMLFAGRNGIHLRYNEESSRGAECLTGWFNDGPMHYNIRIEDTSCRIRKRPDRKYKEESDVTMGETFLSNPDKFNSIRAVIDYLNAEQRKQFQAEHPKVGRQLDDILKAKDEGEAGRE